MLSRGLVVLQADGESYVWCYEKKGSRRGSSAMQLQEYFSNQILCMKEEVRRRVLQLFSTTW